jgi:hypothetical protein
MSLFTWGLIGVFGLWVIVCIGATIDNGLGMMGATAMIVLALAMLLVGHIWGICVAFSESAICGILYWWLPFFALYYLITRWDEMKKPFSVCVLGYILLSQPYWSARFQASARNHHSPLIGNHLHRAVP